MERNYAVTSRRGKRMGAGSGSDSGSGAAYPMTDYRSLITVFYTSHCSSLYILASRSMILRERLM